MHKHLQDARSIIRVQSWHSQPPPPWKAELALGITWPHRTGTVASGHADVVCVGPTDWLMIAADADAALLVQKLDASFEGSSFCAINVSQALARIAIQGPQARELLSKGCSLDLHPSQFSKGRAARTRFVGVPIVVRCTAAAEFELMFARSYLDYLLSWLADAELDL